MYGAHLVEVEVANAREISVCDVPVMNECHTQLLRTVNCAYLTTSHQ